MWKYVFLSYRVHELHQLQSNEQQNKCDRKKGKENPSDPSILTAKRCKCLQWMLNRCVKHLPLCFQITLLEEGCSALPTASSLPGGSTDNEVDTSRPTQPPGENTFKCTIFVIFQGKTVFLNLLGFGSLNWWTNQCEDTTLGFIGNTVSHSSGIFTSQTLVRESSECKTN